MTDRRNPALEGRPVILVHLEYPPGSKLTACTGELFRPPPEDTKTTTPLLACPACVNPRRPTNRTIDAALRALEALESDRREPERYRAEFAEAADELRRYVAWLGVVTR
jgi:hypothetical protein